MKWAVQELNKYKDTGIVIDEDLDMTVALLARDTDVLDLSPIHVVGQLIVNDSEYIAHLTVSCTVTVPSTRSLEPVDVPLTFDIDETYMTATQYAQHIAIEDEDIMILDNDSIDLTEAIADYVLLNIPIQVLSDEEQQGDELPSGEEWEVISESEYLRRQQETETDINPQMAKLQSLLEDDPK